MPNFHHNPELLSELIFALEMSQGEFRLFLARSNTLTQRDRLIQKFQASFSGNLAQLQLDESVGELYATIGQQLGDQQPDALMVWGLESVTDVDKLLISMGLVREEFKNNFHFPILLWIDQEISRKFIRLIPDFESWTSLTVFETPTQELIDFIQQTSNCVYQKVLDNGAGIYLEHTALGVGEFVYQELLDAQQELSNREVSLEPKLEAGLEFVLGRTADNSDETALKHYQRSLELWQEINNQVRVAHTYYYLGLLWRSYELWHGVDKDTSCSRTASYYQKSVETFETANYPDLAAKFINAWGEILQTLEHWDKLETVANRAIELHQTYSHPFREACAYGFLAEVELTKNNYQQAKKLAQKALKILNQTLAKASNCTSIKEEINLDWEFSYHQGKYLFSLAKAEKCLGKIQASIASLEQAKYTTKPEYNAELYIHILTELGGIYYQQKEYFNAFKIKQERQKIEQQFGFQAFVGPNRLRDIKLNINPALPQSKQRTNQKQLTQEIAASGRQSDVEILLERISRPDYKLIVIHGQSGVGKSSILHAGLVPTLEGKSIDTRDVVVVVQRVYVNWISELGKVLEKKLQRIKNFTINSESINSTEEIFEKLKNNAQSNLLTVIIFDQFEEFFFVNMEAKQKQEFAYFLQECLKISFVKIVLSLRSDYIHYLLEFNDLGDLETINNDILSKNILYCLGNFSPSQAKSVIQGLTANSQFKIDEKLTEKLVEDLAEELGKIRPIELQVMGAQLQRDDITTLEKYMELGENPKAKLVEQYLESVVRDCGAENQKLAWLVLLLFTDDNNTRPLKTQAELMKESNFSAEELELVLKIFVDSGLVFLLPQNPADHYQLVHDYLVGFIRQRQGNETLEELKKEREKLRQTEEKRLHLQKRLVIVSIAASFVMAILTGQMTNLALKEQKESIEVKKQTIIAKQNEAIATANESRALSVSGERWDGLIKAMEARQKQIDGKFPATGEASKITTALRVAVYPGNDEFRELNSLTAHENWVRDVAFSPDGEMIASASGDSTVKLWNRQGQLLQILIGHQNSVIGVAFSPDGEMIASASGDSTVKLWNRQGQLLQTLIGHEDSVNGVAFSPDGETIATASDDKTVKLWSRQGQLLQTLTGHQDRVNGVAFSPDGETIATASDDRTVKLWNRQAELLQTLIGHENSVFAVVFSPDGEMIASASGDSTVKLWNQEGQMLQTLIGHENWVRGVAFSPDGKMIASVSSDKTLKLWNLEGELLQTLIGHEDRLRSVAFSPDGETIATASDDSTVKLWKHQEKLLQTLTGHQDWVRGVAFSPDSQMIASASSDRTVKLWNRQGQLLQTLIGHQDRVNGVAFSPDGETIVTGSWDKTVKLWNYQGKLLQTLTGHQDKVRSVALSNDSQMIATASDDRTVKLWNRQGKLLQTLIGHQDRVNSVALSNDSQMIATASSDKTVKLWNRQGKLLHTLTGHENWVNGVALSKDGQMIASASSDKTVKLWNRRGKLLKTLTGHENWVRGVAFSKDGKIIATANSDNTVKLWNPQGQLLQTLIGHKDSVNSVAFSLNDEMIASASSDKTVKLWTNLHIEDLTRDGCQWLNDYLISHPQELEQLRICQTDSPLKEATASLVVEGEKLARESQGEREKLKEAIGKFNQALKWNSNLNLKPKVRAESLVEAEKLMQEGRKLAREGKIEAAIDKYQRAKELDKMALIPIWQNIDPKVKAQDEAVDQFLSQGKEFLKEGKVKDAVKYYKQAEKIDPNLIYADNWNTLCRQGSVDKQAADVMFACDKAVALSPKDANIIDIRGLARALTGDIEGAIADFQVYVEWTDDEEKKAQRQEWIKALQAGENPFTDEVLESFR